MTIKSDFLPHGLFGQIFAWMLDLLPHCDRQGWQRCSWDIKSRLYGPAPGYNIFPTVIETAYEPQPDPPGTASFEDLHFMLNPDREHGGAGAHFRGNFQLAHDCWTRYFRFPAMTRSELFSEKNALGVHYRGTDKNADSFQTNPVSVADFLAVLEDFLSWHRDFDFVFAASDDATFIESLRGFCHNRLPMCCHSHARSTNSEPLFYSHPAQENQWFAEEAVRDCVSLSQCRYMLANMSALSAFAKVLNPDLEAYRIAACKQPWFPHGHTTLYTGKRAAVRDITDRLQKDDWTMR